MAADGKNESEARVDGLVCPRCGLDLDADVTLRAALDGRVDSNMKDRATRAAVDLAAERAREVEMGLEMAKCRVNEAHRALNEMRARVHESERRLSQCEVEWRRSQGDMAQLTAELEHLRAAAEAAEALVARTGA